MESSVEQYIRLIVGLGNPGKEYEKTRHNAGFAVVDAVPPVLRVKFGEKNISGGMLKSGRCGGETLYILKSATYMNASGETVAAFMKKYEIVPEEILLVYDDFDLPLGKIRFCRGGGSSGHRGVESVIIETGTTDFARLRIGIGRGETIGKDRDYVLSEFAEDEKEIFDKIVSMAAEAIKLLLYRGMNEAMNRFNGIYIKDDSHTK